MNEPKELIKYDDFSKIDMRVGTVLSAEEIEGSEKLIRMEVDFGQIGKRQILAGIKMWYKPGDLINKQLPFVINIEPRKMMGLESQGMILAADSNDKAVILLPDSSIENGTSIR
jgi:methionine--tRNA ligase beta chain